MSGPRRLHSVPLRPRRQGVWHALLSTWPGRVMVGGAMARLIVAAIGLWRGTVPAFFSTIDTLAGISLAAGAAYFVFRLALVAKRHLLWRVRRKLILSYIFVGLIPAILIASFFLLCGLLLFYNFSSYLVQSRLAAMEGRARFLAVTAVLDLERAGGRDLAGVLARRRASTTSDASGVSFAIVPAGRACAAGSGGGGGEASATGPTITAGPWSHLTPPSTIPSWIGCAGFSGLFAYQHGADEVTAGRTAPPPAVALSGPRMDLGSATSQDTHLLVRATSFPESAQPGYAVVVDLLLDEEVKREIRRDIGVYLSDGSALPLGGDSQAKPMVGRAGSDGADLGAGSTSGPLTWITFLEFRDWESGSPGTLLVSTRPSISAIYQRISATQGFIGDRSFGQLLLVFLVIVGGLFLVIECIALAAGLALAKSITGSVHQLFVGTERVRRGDFTHKIAVGTDDQLGELAGSFNSMTASIEDLLSQAAEKKRLEEELRIAREIQMSLLPQGTLDMEGLSVSALCVPAREVGGDYYDFFRLGPRRLGVLIADVSGKGTSAALYMAELKGLLLSLCEIHTSPRALMLAANRIIAANLDPRSFITMTYAVVDLDASTMTYARAGHTPLMFMPGARAGLGGGLQVLTPDGLVLGLNIDDGGMFERLLEEHTIDLCPGDVVMLFTDGITEAMNDQDDFFGEDRLGRLIEAHAHLPSHELRERVLRDVHAFVGAARQHDDMTMILMKVEDREVAESLVVDAAAVADYCR